MIMPPNYINMFLYPTNLTCIWLFNTVLEEIRKEQDHTLHCAEIFIAVVELEAEIHDNLTGNIPQTEQCQLSTNYNVCLG